MKKRILDIILVFGLLMVFASADGASAQSRTNLLGLERDARGPAELMVCSQNLYNYGVFADVKQRMPHMSASDFRIKEEALIRRFMRAGCDVIAVQELVAPSEKGAVLVLDRLAELLRAESNRFFEGVVGVSNDRYLRVGFLVARDRADIVNKIAYADIELPKISENQKPRFFAREPLEVQLAVKPLAGGSSKMVTLITFHFKSKGGANRDPSGLEFEPYRMEMAEALRRIVELRHGAALMSGRTILVLLGDRNSNFDSASAKILEGALTLKQFQGDAVCRLSKRGAPLCKSGAQQPQKLFSVLTTNPRTRDLQGTYHYKGIYSWLDDILMPAVALPFAWEGPESSGKYDSGVIYSPQAASDHALVWVRLNW